MHTPSPPSRLGHPDTATERHAIPFGPVLRPVERVEGRCGGRPTFPGSRVEPRHVHARFWAGETLAEIARDFPHIPFPYLRWALLHGHALLLPHEQDGLFSEAAP